MNLAPILLFVYNRPLHTKKTIEALQNNILANESELFIFSDAPKNEEAIKNIAEVREYIRTVKGFKKVTIIERKKNLGLANSIIDGVTKIVNEYGKVIVLEDDLITSTYFLNFMNEALNIYQNDSRIMSITGFNFPLQKFPIPKEYAYDIYLNKRCMSWGWATWKNCWDLVDWKVEDYQQLKNNPKLIKRFNEGGSDLFNILKKQMDGEIDSWAIRFCYAQFKHSKYTIYPKESLVYNNGFDGTGVHCQSKKNMEKIKLREKKIILPIDIQPNEELFSLHKKVYHYSIRNKIENKIKQLIYKSKELF